MLIDAPVTLHMRMAPRARFGHFTLRLVNHGFEPIWIAPAPLLLDGIATRDVFCIEKGGVVCPYEGQTLRTPITPRSRWLRVGGGSEHLWEVDLSGGVYRLPQEGRIRYEAMQRVEYADRERVGMLRSEWLSLSPQRVSEELGVTLESLPVVPAPPPLPLP